MALRDSNSFGPNPGVPEGSDEYGWKVFREPGLTRTQAESGLEPVLQPSQLFLEALGPLFGFPGSLLGVLTSLELSLGSFLSGFSPGFLFLGIQNPLARPLVEDEDPVSLGRDGEPETGCFAEEPPLGIGLDQTVTALAIQPVARQPEAVLVRVPR